ncbi:MAG: cation transporter [Nitrospinota bacterium]|nr:cation transporter [Nitrospinota bacterium]
MKKTVSIEGMTCGNCVRHVTEALKDVEGVTAVTVDLKGKRADVEAGAAVSDEALKAAVAEAGYTATAVN